MSNEVSDFLFSGGARSFQFDNLNDTVSGTIVSAEKRQQTDLDTQTPMTWPDGTPRYQLVITLQTDEKVNDDDDGQRTIYARGGRYEAVEGEGSSMRDAIAEAVRQAKASSLEPGDRLAVALTGFGKKTNRAYNAPKLYSASFKKAERSVSAKDLFGEAESLAKPDPF